MNTYIDLESRYCAHNYHPLPVVLTHGEGVFVWDESGKKYLDMMSAYSAVSHGHANPRLVQLVRDQVGTLNIVSRAFYTDKLGPFLAKACELTGQDMALPMNTGAEAVETAIKAARKWAYTVKGVADDKAEIIACSGNFHGRTIDHRRDVGRTAVPGRFRAVSRRLPPSSSTAASTRSRARSTKTPRPFSSSPSRAKAASSCRRTVTCRPRRSCAASTTCC